MPCADSPAVAYRCAAALVLGCVVLASGCAHTGRSETQIVHVVLVWLKDAGNAKHKAQIIDATRGFAQLPGVVEVRVGEPMPSSRPVVDASFDVGLYMVFQSNDALKRYLTHPLHKETVQKVLRPLAHKTIVYDFIDARK